MPRTTFENLAADKKSRILQAAIDEFAAYCFSEASINRIVKAAGIPRGSFYQYFKDKEDIYLLVVERIGQAKGEIFAAHPAPSQDAGFLETAAASIPAILDWIERCPQYDKVEMLMTRDESAFVRQMAEQLAAKDASAAGALRRDQERGLIRQDVDAELLVQTILPMSMTLLRGYYANGGRDAAMDRMKTLFDIISNGIRPR